MTVLYNVYDNVSSAALAVQIWTCSWFNVHIYSYVFGRHFYTNGLYRTTTWSDIITHNTYYKMKDMLKCRYMTFSFSPKYILLYVNFCVHSLKRKGVFFIFWWLNASALKYCKFPSPHLIFFHHYESLEAL